MLSFVRNTSEARRASVTVALLDVHNERANQVREQRRPASDGARQPAPITIPPRLRSLDAPMHAVERTFSVPLALLVVARLGEQDRKRVHRCIWGAFFAFD